MQNSQVVHVNMPEKMDGIRPFLQELHPLARGDLKGKRKGRLQLRNQERREEIPRTEQGVGEATV